MPAFNSFNFSVSSKIISFIQTFQFQCVQFSRKLQHFPPYVFFYFLSCEYILHLLWISNLNKKVSKCIEGYLISCCWNLEKLICSNWCPFGVRYPIRIDSMSFNVMVIYIKISKLLSHYIIIQLLLYQWYWNNF